MNAGILEVNYFGRKDISQSGTPNHAPICSSSVAPCTYAPKYSLSRKYRVSKYRYCSLVYGPARGGHTQKPGALKQRGDSDTFETRYFQERLYIPPFPPGCPHLPLTTLAASLAHRAPARCAAADGVRQLHRAPRAGTGAGDRAAGRHQPGARANRQPVCR